MYLTSPDSMFDALCPLTYISNLKFGRVFGFVFNFIYYIVGKRESIPIYHWFTPQMGTSRAKANSLGLYPEAPIGTQPSETDQCILEVAKAANSSQEPKLTIEPRPSSVGWEWAQPLD